MNCVIVVLFSIFQYAYLEGNVEQSWHSDGPSSRHSGALSFRHSGAPEYWNFGASQHWHSGAPEYWHSNDPKYWHSGSPEYWHSGAPSFHHSKKPEYWHSGSPEYWYPGAQLPRRTSAPSRNSAPESTTAPGRTWTPWRNTAPERTWPPKITLAPGSISPPEGTSAPSRNSAPESPSAPSLNSAPESTSIPWRTLPPKITLVPGCTSPPESTSAPLSTSAPERTSAPESSSSPETTSIPLRTSAPVSISTTGRILVPETTSAPERTTSAPERTTSAAGRTSAPESSSSPETTSTPLRTSAPVIISAPETTSAPERTTSAPERTTAPLRTSAPGRISATERISAPESTFAPESTSPSERTSAPERTSPSESTSAPAQVLTLPLPLTGPGVPSSALTRSISEQKCRGYSTFVQNIFTISVVGGTDTSTSEFPHMVSLGYAREDEKLWRCAGSLISYQFVLTAGHCLQSAEFGNISWVRLGELNLPAQSEFLNDYRIIERIAHPQYRAPSAYNDIALVKLERTVDITTFVPACLYTNPNIAPDATLIATGWGLTGFAGEPSENLQKVDLDLFSEQECTEAYNNIAGTRKLTSGIFSERQVCAGGRTMEKDTCQGDSGGPLQITSFLNGTKIFRIVGVTSFGKTCGTVNIPGVYSRVSYYVPWIESVVWPRE